MVVVGPLVAVVATLVTVIGGVVGAITALVALISTVGLPVFAGIAAAVVLLTGYLIAGIAVFGSIATAIGIVVTKTGMLQWAFENIKAIIGAVVAIFRGDLDQAFTLLTEKFGMSKEQAQLFIQKIAGARDALFKVGEVIKNVTSLLGTIFTADKQKMIDLLMKKFGFTKDEAKRFSDKVEELRGKIIRVGAKMKEVASGAISKFAEIIKKAAQFVYDHRKEIALIIEKIIDFGLAAGTLAKDIYEAFKTIKGDITDAMDKGEAAINKVKDAFDSVKKAIGNVIDKLSSLKFPSPPSWLTDKIPGFATGVKNFAGGWAIVGERGPELVNLPRGSDVYTAQQTKGMIGSSKSYSQNVSSQTENNVYNVNMSINARDIKEVNDIIELFNGLKAEPTY